ncbi:hypothetical protein BpHYR1_017034 [Brachionus plicatilis]|uniref:Uncharacterized protein n=1 Tax=Brachionus plicatilis TaxID=10195 RepID=A0A3M7QNI8_BRAPC|nr:hypothetical protein BpHYR1_017034 [Brachionus plicatilis]
MTHSSHNLIRKKRSLILRTIEIKALDPLYLFIYLIDSLRKQENKETQIDCSAYADDSNLRARTKKSEMNFIPVIKCSLDI